MIYSPFGTLDWQVSRISIGTVELGIPYGFAYAGEAPVPDRAEAKRLLLQAFAAGINLVDTAPTYGTAEEIVGEALREWSGPPIYLAGKIPTWGDRIEETVHESLRRLKRDCLDLLQIYSGSPDADAVRRSLDIARRLQEQGKARALGISLYEESIARLALDTVDLTALQVPFNLLDQRMAVQLLPAAEAKGRAILGRSALLKGILTERRHSTPPGLARLVEAAATFAGAPGTSPWTLSQLAIAFCVSQSGISTVLVGIRNEAELKAALASLECGIDLEAWRGYRFPHDPNLLDPRQWTGL